MNTKTYNLTKYLATIGAVLLFTGPLLTFLQAWKDIFKGHDEALIGVSLTLTLIGVSLIIGYLCLRWHLKNKTTYQHTTRDLLFLKLAFLAYFLGTFFALIMTILGLTLTSDKAIMISFAPIYVLELVFLIGASILESVSRIDEQIYLYQQENERQTNSTTDVPSQAAYSESGVKRTKEAQALFEKTARLSVDNDEQAALQAALDESDANEK